MSKRDDPGAERFRKAHEREQDYKKQLPGENDPPLPPPVEPIKSEAAPERNDPCPCGSGKKYKKCCGRGGAKPGAKG